MLEGYEIVVSLRNENETSSCNGNFYEGDVQRVALEMGEHKKLTFSPEKYVYLPSIRKCRQRPYKDLLIDSLLKNVQKSCTMPCKPDSDFSFCFAMRQSKAIDQLPLCMNKNDTNCFYNSFDAAQESLNIYSGPCTKHQHLMVSKFDNPIAEDTEIQLDMTFDPPRTTVREEYLIYDMVALISAIGGTMGLCIGFSFTHFTSTTLTLIERMVNKFQNNRNPKSSKNIRDQSEDNFGALKSKFQEQEKINSKLENEIANLTQSYLQLKYQITSQGLAKENDKFRVTDLEYTGLSKQ